MTAVKKFVQPTVVIFSRQRKIYKHNCLTVICLSVLVQLQFTPKSHQSYIIHAMKTLKEEFNKRY